jgi:hypothetical protein
LFNRTETPYFCQAFLMAQHENATKLELFSQNKFSKMKTITKVNTHLLAERWLVGSLILLNIFK